MPGTSSLLDGPGCTTWTASERIEVPFATDFNGPFDNDFNGPEALVLAALYKFDASISAKTPANARLPAVFELARTVSPQ